MKDPNRISVVMIQHIFFPLWAGPAERFLRYVPGLSERSVDLSFVTAMRPDLPREELMEGAEVFRIGPAQKGVGSYTRFTIRAFFKAIRLKAEVVLLFGLSPIHIPFLWILKWMGVKTVFINTMSRDRGEKVRTFKDRLSDYLHLKLLCSVDRLVFSSELLSSYIYSLGYKHKNRVHIIANGVNVQRFAPASNTGEKQALRSELQLPQSELIFLYVGLRVPRKGVLELIQGWKLYKDQGGAGTLLLVGRDQHEKPELAAFYKTWESELNSLTEEHKLLTHPSSKEIEKYFKASDAFVFFSKHEGMPNVILEAMSCALPVLTTRFKGFSDVFGRDGEELIITTHQREKIAESLGIMAQPEQMNRLSLNARNWILNYQELGIIQDKYVGLFKDLLSK